MTVKVFSHITFTFCFIVTMNMTHAQSSFYDLYLSPGNNLEQVLLDDINPVDFYNDLQKYNANNNILNKRSDYRYKIDSIVLWDKNSSFQWVRESKTEIFFEDVDLKEINLTSFKNFTTGIFGADNFSVFHYNKKDLLTKQTYNAWSGIYGDWDDNSPITISEYFYNENNQLERYEDQSSSAIQSNRILNLSLFKYDSQNLPVSVSHFHWFAPNDTMTHTRETTYLHNSEQNLEQIINWKFDEDRGWEYVDSTIISYTESGQVEKETSYPWSPNKGFWLYEEKINRYNEDISIDEIVYYSGFNEEENEWSGIDIEVFRYHDYGSLRKITKYDSTFFDFGKDKIAKTTFTHNSEVESSQIKFHRHRDFAQDSKTHHFENHMLLESSFYNGGGMQSPESLRYQARFHYTELETNSVDDDNIQSIAKVYPNPVVDNLYFDVPNYQGQFDVQISDLEGKVLIRKSLTDGDYLSMEDLTDGVYIYTLIFGSHIESGKVVKLK